MSTQTTCSYIYLLRITFTTRTNSPCICQHSYIYLLRVSLTLLLQTVPVYVNTNYLLLYIPTSCILNSTPTNSPCICQQPCNYMLLYIPTSCILNSTPTNSPCIYQHKLLAPVYIYTYFVYP